MDEDYVLRLIYEALDKGDVNTYKFLAYNNMPLIPTYYREDIVWMIENDALDHVAYLVSEGLSGGTPYYLYVRVRDSLRITYSRVLADAFLKGLFFIQNDYSYYESNLEYVLYLRLQDYKTNFV